MSIGYQLKITIQGSKPLIWRRVIVPEHITFCDLDDVIEKIFGWTHSHLYEFIIKDWGMRITGAPLMEEEDNADECIDSWMHVGGEIMYTYDFGDNWEHLIKVEKIVEYEYRYPTVLASKGSNMIEDCGGMWGFQSCKDEAESFDIEAVNKEFQTWNIPIAEPVDELMDFLWDDDCEDEDLDYDDLDDDGDFWDDIEDEIAFDEEKIRSKFGKVEFLEYIYNQYTKDNLTEIAKIHGLKGYSKLNKKELISWLKERLLEETYMTKFILQAENEELSLFEDAINENGIFMPEQVLERSLLLSTYGGFLPYYNFYHVPSDVQNVYKKLMVGEVRAKVESQMEFLEICESCMFLYGVVSFEDLHSICQKYGMADMSEAEMLEKLQTIVNKDNMLTLKNGYFMDERLVEEDLYLDVLKEQEKMERFLPEEKEEFLEYGRNGFQEPNEDTRFFLEYLMKEANLNNAQATLAFCLVQEAIRMNRDEEELIELLLELGCSLKRHKQFEKAEKMLKKLSNRTRKWDYNGHTSMELNRGIVEFPRKK